LTTAACEKLKDAELEGVIAHEMSHIKNFDVRFMTLIAVMVGAIAIFSEMFLRSLWYGGGSRDSDNGKGNAIFFLIAILLAIIAPLVVKIVQLSISRKREYLADSSSVQFTRYPVGLISALKKIDSVNKPVKVTSAMQPLFFAETWPEKKESAFSTHPPISARIRALQEMA
jgi:heat shock protein HtpX